MIIPNPLIILKKIRPEKSGRIKGRNTKVNFNLLFNLNGGWSSSRNFSF